MKKINGVLIMIALMVGSVFGSTTVLSTTTFPTTVFPTFDMNRGDWLDYKEFGTPIVVDDLTQLGLTNPALGQMSYSFKFEVISDEITFGNPNYSEDFLFLKRPDNNTLILEGLHNGDEGGIPMSGLIMSGSGVVNIYEKEFNNCSSTYEYLGSFTVGSSIPEPCTVLLLGGGFFLFLCFPKRRKI